MPITHHFAKSTDYNKLLTGIFIGSILVNLFAALWEFKYPGVIKGFSWKFLKTLFYITFALCPYAAVSVLLSVKYAWGMFTLFALISIIITLLICYEKPEHSLTLDQGLPTTNAATAAEEGEELNDLGGSGSSPNLPSLSATGHSQEQPILNGLTTIVTQNWFCYSYFFLNKFTCRLFEHKIDVIFFFFFVINMWFLIVPNKGAAREALWLCFNVLMGLNL